MSGVSHSSSSAGEDGGDDDSRTTLGESGGPPKFQLLREDTQSQDPVVAYGHNNDNAGPITGRTNAAEEINDTFNRLNNEQHEQQQQEATSDEAVVTMTQKPKRHPNTDKLLIDHWEACLQLLKAVDDVGCASSTMASDKADAKGNKWAKLLDVRHGGGVRGGGAMARHGWAPISKASLFKRKIIDVWQFGCNNEDKVRADICECCRRQYDEYLAAKNKEKENSNKQKADADKQQQEMLAYQQSMLARPEGARTSALPPAARGQVGGGRGQHSTNTRLGNPATFGVAHLQSTNEQQNISPLSSVTGSGSRSGSRSNNNNSNNGNSTPGRHSPNPTRGISPTRGTLTLHNNAMETISGLQTDVHSLIAARVRPAEDTTPARSANTVSQKRERKIERLERLSKRLKEDSLFYNQPGKEAQYEESLNEYESVSKELRALYKEEEESEEP